MKILQENWQTLLKEASEAGADTVFQTTIMDNVQKLVQMSNVYGDVGKLTQIGTVNDNVLIISKKAVKEALPRSFQSAIARGVTDYIHVVVKSNRFDRQASPGFARLACG